MNEMPLFLFIFLIIVMFYFMLSSLHDINMWSLFSSIMSVMLSFILAKISINEQLVYNFGHISSVDVITYGTHSIQHSGQSWLLTMVAIFMTIRLLMILIENYKEIYGEVTE
jgi:hypothetical protein